MIFKSTLTGKNQTTLPKAVVKALGATPSCKLTYVDLGDGSFRLTAKSETFESLADSFPKKKPAKPVSIEDMNNAIKQSAVRRYQQSNK